MRLSVIVAFVGAATLFGPAATAAPPSSRALQGTGGSARGDFAVARLRTDGSLDSTFGNLGLVTTDFGVLVGPFPAPEYGSDVAVQSDGTIVVAGTSEFDRGSDLAVVRYLDDGGLHTSFAIGGKLTVDFNGGFDSGHDVAIEGDGKIVAVGTAANGTSIEFALVRVIP